LADNKGGERAGTFGVKRKRTSDEGIGDQERERLISEKGTKRQGGQQPYFWGRQMLRSSIGRERQKRIQGAPR